MHLFHYNPAEHDDLRPPPVLEMLQDLADRIVEQQRPSQVANGNASVLESIWRNIVLPKQKHETEHETQHEERSERAETEQQ